VQLANRDFIRFGQRSSSKLVWVGFAFFVLLYPFVVIPGEVTFELLTRGTHGDYFVCIKRQFEVCQHFFNFICITLHLNGL
jgi:hypothetical protein